MEQAIELLLTGQNDRQVAEELGIHRVTVSRWRLYHPAFRAVLNQRRNLLVAGIQDKFRALVAAAFDTMLDIVRTPGPDQTDVARDVFHRATAQGLSLGPSGETDPYMIVEHEAKAKNDRHEARLRARDRGEVTVADWEATHEDLLWKANEPPPEDPTT